MSIAGVTDSALKMSFGAGTANHMKLGSITIKNSTKPEISKLSLYFFKSITLCQIPIYIYIFKFKSSYCVNYTMKLVNDSTSTFVRYEKSSNSFLPGLPRSIINQFRFHNLLCLCLASVHLPHPFHLVSAFSCSVTPLCSASNRTISSMRFRAVSSILAQCSKILSDNTSSLNR